MSSIKNIIPLDLLEFGRPPQPTIQLPFAQIDWIFERRMSRVQSKSGKDNYKIGLKYYKRFLANTHGRHPYLIRDQWNEFSLLEFAQYLDTQESRSENKLGSYSLIGIMSAVRQSIKEALSYRLLNCSDIQDVSYGSAHRETDAHASYSDAELSQILAAVAIEMRFTNKVFSGYSPQDQSIGKDPNISIRIGKEKGYGYGLEENMRWYFEHRMDAKAIPSIGEDKVLHRKFFTAATNLHAGLHNLYRKWGVTAFIDENIVMPIVVNLVYLTGLNPSSLLKLKIDCLKDEHPLTGMPYILFEKERSGGENELHLPLLDNRIEQSLKRKQSIRVKKAIETQLALTKSVRDLIPSSCDEKNRLFIYQSTGPRTHGQVKVLSDKTSSHWCQTMIVKHGLHSDSGEPLIFNLVRFRSTKLTEMALEGRDFFEIQQVARHKSIATTLKYINTNRLDIEARKTITEALERIHSNRMEDQEKATIQSKQVQPIHLFKGILSDCKNTFDPPDRIKKSVGYVPGQACTNFNMCLFCKNVIVMREHLPVLTTYRGQLISSLSNNIQNLPHANLYNMTLEVLNDLLDPDHGEFSCEDLEWAIEMSETIDIVIDPLVYQGVGK